MDSAILNDPFLLAKKHLLELTRGLPSGTVPVSVIQDLSSMHPDWPVWPDLALSDLIGPPNVRLKEVDLRWLHRFRATIALLGWLSAQLGGPKGGPSALSLVVERAPILGHRGWGAVSAGGSCRILTTADGQIAANLPRVEDQSSVAAWLDAPIEGTDWASIERAVQQVTSSELLSRAKLLGMPISAVGETKVPLGFGYNIGKEIRLKQKPRVVDLSSMWAGPLCSWYLMRCGAEVTKIESLLRPEKQRNRPDIFYQRLNQGKEIIPLDFSSSIDLERLRNIIRGSDIIIEGSRPRALEQLGIDAKEEVERGAIWCSITGYGRRWNPHRVGFGDDAAAGANLLAEINGSLWFMGDAIADPITGATAATLVLGYWLGCSSALLDLGLSPTAALYSQGLLSRASSF